MHHLRLKISLYLQWILYSYQFSWYKYVPLKTRLWAQIMHQNLAVNSCQLSKGKPSFAVLVPGCSAGLLRYGYLDCIFQLKAENYFLPRLHNDDDDHDDTNNENSYYKWGIGRENTHYEPTSPQPKWELALQHRALKFICNWMRAI